MALPNDVERIAKAVANIESSSPDYAGSKTLAAKRLIRRSYTFEKAAADSMASDTTAYTATPGFSAPTDGRLLSVKFTPRGAATANDTTYATLNLNKSDGAGGAATVMASITTQITGGSGNLAAGVTKTFTLSATIANRNYTKGQLLSPSIAKASTGVVVPAGTYQIDVEEEGTDDFGVG